MSPYMPPQMLSLFLRHHIRPLLRPNAQPTPPATGVRAIPFARRIALAIRHLGCACHAVPAETLRAIFGPCDTVAGGETVVGAVRRGLSAAPVGEGAGVAVGGEVRVAALIGPGVGGGGGFDGHGAGGRGGGTAGGCWWRGGGGG